MTKSIENLQEEIKTVYVKASKIKEEAESILTSKVLEIEELRNIILSDNILKYSVTSEKDYSYKVNKETFKFRISLSIKKNNNFNENFYLEVSNDDFYLNWFSTSADKDSVAILNYIETVGKIASFLKKEENVTLLRNILNSCNNKLEESYNMLKEIYGLEEEIKAIKIIEIENKKKEIESKIFVNSLIEFDDNKVFNLNRSGKDLKIVIEKVTPKYVEYTYFISDVNSGTTPAGLIKDKKDNLINDLLRVAIK